MMGLDPDQRVRLYKWSDAMMAGDSAADSDDDPLMLAAAEAFGEYAGMCLELIAERREQPDARDDIITALTRAYDEGALAREDRAGQDVDAEVPLTDDELIMFLVLIVVAGNETTRNALTGGLLAFSRSEEHTSELQSSELQSLM